MNESFNNNESIIPSLSSHKQKPFNLNVKSTDSFPDSSLIVPPPFNFTIQKTFSCQISLSELSQTLEKSQTLVLFPYYVINPLGKFKKIWNFIMLLAIFYTLWVYPARLAFNSFILAWDDGSIYLDIAIDICFLWDIFLNFFSAFEDKQGKLVYQFSEIMISYMKTTFIFDIITTIPFYWLIPISEGEESNQNQDALFFQAYKEIKILSILRILKIFRFKSFNRQIEHFFLKRLKIRQQIYLILTFICLIVFTMHLSACIWFFLCQLEDVDNLPNSWIFANDLQPSNSYVFEQYITSIYFVLTILMSVGYGNEAPRTEREKIIFVITVFFALGMFAYIMGMCIRLFNNKASNVVQFFGKIKVFLEDFTIKFRISKVLYWKMLFSFEKSCFNGHNNLQIYQEKLMKHLPLELHYEVLNSIFNDLSHEFSFFLDKPKSFITQLIPYLKPSYFSPGDEIYKNGDPASHIYFIQKGRAITCCEDDNGVERAQIYIKGTYFGEVEILMKHERSENCFAEEELRLLKLEKSFFLRLLEEFEDIKSEMMALAIKRSYIRKRDKKSNLKKKPLLPRSYWIWSKNKECLENSIEDTHFNLNERKSVIRKSIVEWCPASRSGNRNPLLKKSKKAIHLAKIVKFTGTTSDLKENDVEIEEKEIEIIGKEKIAGFFRDEEGFVEDRKDIMDVFQILEERENIKRENKKHCGWKEKELDEIMDYSMNVNEILKMFLKDE